VPSIQPLEAGRERGRMTHQNDDLEIDVSREPVAGEGRDRILVDQAATSERREPVLWLVLKEELPCAPPEDLVEGFQGTVLRQSWRVGEPVFCEAIERVGPEDSMLNGSCATKVSSVSASMLASHVEPER
jgi:hypothetical protein